MRLFALCLLVAVGVNALLIFVHRDPWTWTAFLPSLVAGFGVVLMFFWPDIRRPLPLPPRAPKAEPTDPPWAGIRVRTGAVWIALGLIYLDLFLVDSAMWSAIVKSLTASVIAWALLRNRAVLKAALDDRRTRMRGIGFAVAFGSLTAIHFLGDGAVSYALGGLIAIVVLVWPKPFRP
jgi:hypothetical protein